MSDSETHWKPPPLTFEDNAKIEHAKAMLERKRKARELRRAQGAPPPDGGATGRSVTFTAELEEP